MRKIITFSALALGSALFASAPAQAGLFHTHYCSCGDPTGAAMCGGTTSTTSGGTTTTSGGTTTTSGGTTTTSGGTAVPEPGMMGLMGLSLIGLGAARRRKARRA